MDIYRPFIGAILGAALAGMMVWATFSMRSINEKSLLKRRQRVTGSIIKKLEDL